jgi:hypothetical protein
MSVHNAPERIGFLLVVLGLTFVKIEALCLEFRLFFGLLALGLGSTEFGPIGFRRALFFSARPILAGLTEIDDLSHF